MTLSWKEEAQKIPCWAGARLHSGAVCTIPHRLKTGSRVYGSAQAMYFDKSDSLAHDVDEVDVDPFIPDVLDPGYHRQLALHHGAPAEDVEIACLAVVANVYGITWVILKAGWEEPGDGRGNGCYFRWEGDVEIHSILKDANTRYADGRLAGPEVPELRRLALALAWNEQPPRFVVRK